MKDLRKKIESISAVLFDRISSSAQEGGLSIQMQEEEGFRYAMTRGLTIVKVFAITESGWSAEDRKVFKQMLAYCQGNNIRHVICRDTSRLARNMRDSSLIAEVLIKQDFTFHLHQENIVLSRESTPTDLLVFSINSAVAKNHSDIISKKVSDVHARKRRDGIPHSIPWGYQWDSQARRVIINEDLRDTLTYVFNAFDSGRYTIRTLADHLNEKGIKAPKGGDWKRNSGQIHSILKNPFYHGELSSTRGEVVRGKHETFYSKDVYERRMKLLRDRYAPRKARKKHFHFANIVRCSCGRTFTGHEIPIKVAGGQTKPVVHYVHKCDHLAGKQLTLRESKIVEIISSRLADLCFNAAFAEELAESFRQYSKGKRSYKSSEKATITAKITRAHAAISQLLDLTGKIPNEHLIAKVEEKEKEIRFLETKARALDASPSKTINRILETIMRVERAPAAFARAPIEEKAVFLRETVQLVVYDRGRISFEFHEPISWLLTDEMTAVFSRAKVRNSLRMLPRLGSNQGPSD